MDDIRKKRGDYMFTVSPLLALTSILFCYHPKGKRAKTDRGWTCHVSAHIYLRTVVLGVFTALSADFLNYNYQVYYPKNV